MKMCDGFRSRQWWTAFISKSWKTGICRIRRLCKSELSRQPLQYFYSLLILRTMHRNKESTVQARELFKKWTEKCRNDKACRCVKCRPLFENFSWQIVTSAIFHCNTCLVMRRKDQHYFTMDSTGSIWNQSVDAIGFHVFLLPFSHLKPGHRLLKGTGSPPWYRTWGNSTSVARDDNV